MAIPVVYNYDNNGYYTGASTPQKSPLEPGKYLTPARATTTPPPLDPSGALVPPQAGKEYKWNPPTNQWVLATSRAILLQNQKAAAAAALTASLANAGGSF
jgi:hypothetical protein